MDQLHTLKVFQTIAEQGSFAAAARALGLSPPAVTRAIAALETRVGMPLFVRTTRHVRLTEAGQHYAHDVRRILAELELAESALTGSHAEPKGSLTVTAPAMFGRLYVTPMLVAFLKHYPEVSVHALLIDRVTHLLEEGIDIGFRIGPLPDSSLHAIPLGHVRKKCYASPDYLEQRGVPSHPSELEHHDVVAYARSSGPVRWTFFDNTRAIHQAVTPRLYCSSNDATVTATAEGLGISRVLSYQADAEIRAGSLVAVLEAFDGEPIPVHLVYAHGRNVPAKMRVLIDFVRETFANMPVLHSP